MALKPFTSETAPRAVARAVAGPVAPSIGLARMIRSMTGDGEILANFLCEVVADPETPMRDRLSAAGMLLDRGFGAPLRAELQIQAHASDAGALSALADGELARIADLLSSRTGPSAPVVPSLDAMASADILPEYRPLPPEPVTLPDVNVTIPPEGEPAPGGSIPAPLESANGPDDRDDGAQ